MKEEVFSFANLNNVAFLEDLYQLYQKDPGLVDTSWRYFFSGMEFSLKDNASLGGGGDLKVFKLILAYRTYGHKKAKFSPLSEQKAVVPELELASFGLTSEEMNKSFLTFGLLPEKEAPLAKILEQLEKVYCGSVGFEFMGLSKEVESWMISELEGGRSKGLSSEEKKTVLKDLIAAELFESFIHTKYPGQTRFSLEGGETFIPILNALVESGTSLQVEELFLGMAHRGRLNVLVHVLKKPYLHIFHEFEDIAEEEDGSGDVKYHKGAHTNRQSSSGRFIEIALVPNPSHLESIDPVVEGQARAKQDLKGGGEARKKVASVLVHGDASLAGQGVVYEILQMGQLEGYSAGGTLHVAINNHIGYTTLPEQSRSTLYCTDIAKTFGAPVFHINAEDPEECVRAAQLAMKFRQMFHTDVFLDLNCYRKYGHNEGDEPTFTQPLLYQKIRAKRSIRKIFGEKLVAEGLLSEEEIGREEGDIMAKLQEAFTSAQAKKAAGPVPFQKKACVPMEDLAPPVAAEAIIGLAERFCKVPPGFKIHPKLQRLVQERQDMIQWKEPESGRIDWGMGEHLAYASLLQEKITVRLSGQDVERGTFSHRHSAWIDQESGQKYFPLKNLSKEQAPFYVYNSLLSEFAVMGFDLGYSLSYPKSLVLWEAQFGDFVNGAQVIIDQYLATSEQKWARYSNLTLLLPHGYEGKGPEHSSARMERFLQMCAEDNFIVANATTPAQFFHLLRRQAYLRQKRPLVVFSPKALLRHPACISSLADFTQKRFQKVLDDPTSPQEPSQIFFCSGKVFYDLLQEREKRQDRKVALVRVEQLYPFPAEEILELLKKYPKAQQHVWVQEEHQNMGPWTYVRPKFQDLLGISLRYAGREESASPAAGSYGLHKKQLESLMQKAFQNHEVAQ